MADPDKDLVNLFVRDLDAIELPPRDRWRLAPRKESHVVRTGRYVFYASAVAAVLVLALIAGFALRDGNQVSASPSPTPPTAASPSTATMSPAATGSPTPSPASGRYVSATLGYSIETPPPWHRSSCQPVATRQSDESSGSDEFVPVSTRDETFTEIGPAYPTVRVNVEANPQNLSPRQWAERDPTVVRPRIEDVVYADRPAAREVFPGAFAARYFVASGGRMYSVEPRFSSPNSPPGGTMPEPATVRTMVGIVESFRFLTEAEQAAARAALPSALPSRTPEQVADGVAAAMTAKNADALAGFLAPCVHTGGEQAGGTTVSRDKYLDDLRAAFAAGLVVTVQPRPLEERAPGILTVASTWQDSRGTKERKLMLRRGDNDRWEWWGTLERFQ
jgi:hypothetical protein